MREAAVLIQQRLVDGQADLVGVEETLKNAALRDAARLLGNFYSGVLPSVLGLEQPKGRSSVRTRTILSTLGPIDVTRAYVVDPQARRYFPLDDALGFAGGCTPAAASLITWAGAQMGSYDLAGEALCRLAGIGVSGRRVQRLVNRVAESETSWAQARPQEKPTVDILNIQADMTGIPMRKEDLVGVEGKNGDPKKRQIKGGIVFHQTVNAKGEIQRVPGSTTRVVSFDDVPAFATALFTEASLRGYASTPTVVFTSDGAEWIWKMVSDRFRGAIQIVDFYHAAEHLGELCHLVEPDQQKAEALFALRRRLMRDYGAGCVIRYFQAQPPEHPRSKEIQERLRYFTTNLHRMDYRRFRQHGYFIGSGAMEGTCKSLVKQRTDLAGQRWHLSGSLNVLRIRALVADQLHDRYWKQRATLNLPRAA